MIEAKKLMIGDWICLHTDMAELVPCQVSWLKEPRIQFKNVQLKNGVLSGNEDNEDFFSPIPITAEILERNEFDEKQSCWFISKVNYAIMVTWLGSDGFKCTIDSNSVYVSVVCHYVHELQHILRVCDLDELADNFKVE